MGKRFVAKKKRRLKLKFRYCIYLIFVCFICQITFNVLVDTKLTNSNEEFIKKLLVDSNHNILYEKSSNSFIYKISRVISNIDPSNPESILKKLFGEKIEDRKSVFAYNNMKTNYVVNDINPRVYIYNTHQGEQYSNKNLEDYNISSDIMTATELLQKKLTDLGISTIIEKGNILEFMQINNMNHNQSYDASVYYLKSAIEKYDSIELIIDLHRDAVNHNISTTTIDGKDYAKTMFVVGTNHNNYKENLDLANNMNNILKSKYPSLTRGIYTRGYTYNQDVSPKMVLIELGGNENNMLEVINTINILAETIKEQLEK